MAVLRIEREVLPFLPPSPPHFREGGALVDWGCRRIAGFAPAPGDGRCVWSRREQFRHAEKVVGSAYEVGCELGPFDSAESRFAKAAEHTSSVLELIRDVLHGSSPLTP